MRQVEISVERVASPDWEPELREWDSSIEDILDSAESLKEVMHRYRDTKGGLLELSIAVGDMGRVACALEERMDGFLESRVPHGDGCPWYIG